MTATSLQPLRESLTLTREVYGRRSSQAERAFSLLIRTAAENGTPLDGLRHYVEDEVERFFSYTIPGPDGHVYWDGPKVFRRNDGKGRTPLRWWWQHRYGSLANSDDLALKCGEENCINPEHHAKERTRTSSIRWTPDRIIGALQVWALRNGHSPSVTEWERTHGYPVHSVVKRSFGNWAKALNAAGLEGTRGVGSPATKSEVLAGIRFARKLLGKWPSNHDYRKLRAHLIAAGLPSTVAPATRQYGSFAAARVAAGGPPAVVSDAQRKAWPGRSAADCVAALRFCHERLGHWPTHTELRALAPELKAAGLPSTETPFRRIFGSFVKAREFAQRPHESAGPSGRESPPNTRSES